MYASVAVAVIVWSGETDTNVGLAAVEMATGARGVTTMTGYLSRLGMFLAVVLRGNEVVYSVNGVVNIAVGAFEVDRSLLGAANELVG